MKNGLVYIVVLSLGSGVAWAQNTTDSAYTPNNANLPIGLTWVVGYKDAVLQSDYDAAANQLKVISKVIWKITKGKIYLAKVKFFDQVATSSNASVGSGSGWPNNVDVWVKTTWNEPGGVLSYVVFGPVGRMGDRLVVFPKSALQATYANGTILHEAGHFLFKITNWGNAPGAASLPPGLPDEYADSGNLAADQCIMNLKFSPPRICYTADGSHPTLALQGTVSCWNAIMLNYGNFVGVASQADADPNTAPATTFEYTQGPPGSPGTTSSGPGPNTGSNSTPTNSPSNSSGSSGGGGSGGGGGGSACYVATAAYGDANALPVRELVTFRDTRLVTNASGSAFVRTYEAMAPQPAMALRNASSVRVAVAMFAELANVGTFLVLLAGVFFVRALRARART